MVVGETMIHTRNIIKWEIMENIWLKLQSTTKFVNLDKFCVEFGIWSAKKK